MKNIKSYIATAAIATALLSAVSCKKDFYTKANVNPNSPNTVTPATLLTGVEVSLGYTYGGDLSRFASMFTQQTYGASRQASAYYSYIFTNQDPESNWDNWYDDVMENDYQLMLLSNQASAHEYAGIAQILMAFSLQSTVDAWGSIPYSQAFLGSANMKPAFDKDQALYDTAMSLCNRGIANINASASDATVPGTDDVMYGGSATKWIEFAHAIKARLYIHQTKHDNAQMADSAIAEANRSFPSDADNAVLIFGTSETNANPWYEFNEQRTDIYFAYGPTPNGYTTLGDSMLMNSDPRYPVYIDSLGDGFEDVTYGGLSTYYGDANSPVEFITYEELQFIIAEANIRVAHIGTAGQAAYTSAITANMTKLGIGAGAIATYLASHNGTLPATEATALAQLGFQVNLSLYLNPEVWTTWRRCNWTITPTSSNAAGGVPRRLLYPQSELNLNSGNVPAATQVTPAIFWDN